MKSMIKRFFFHERLMTRILSLFIIFLFLFNLITIISYYLLPEGFLLGKNSILDWETADSVILSTFQILSYNLISVILIVFANYFPFPSQKNMLMPLGYWCFIVQITLNAITLGTWSFTTVTTVSPDLVTRLLRTFDVMHRAGLWEMTGQLIIACATARIAVRNEGGNDRYIHSVKESHLNRREIAAIIAGICLMLAGAFIESKGIIQQTIPVTLAALR